jgi:hypothetical protein
MLREKELEYHSMKEGPGFCAAIERKRRGRGWGVKSAFKYS